MVISATHSGKRYEYTAYGKRQVFSYAGNGTNDPLCLTARGSAPRVLDGPFVDDGTGLVQPYSINPFGHQGLYHDEHLGSASGVGDHARAAWSLRWGQAP